ncbi:MAG TPA: hypothetical protein PLW23_02165 [Bacteroidales bacterium]|nr:hypothetical protein [Bacteroidales bacterium]
MKKTIFVALALFGMAAILFSSCKKECTCTTYLDEKEISSTTFELEKGQKCEDLGTPIVSGTGVECK